MNGITQHFEQKRFRKEHKLMVRKWYADQGEDRLRFEYPLNADSTVLDLGGYKGQWASDLFARYQCRIHVFEPVLGFCRQIEERFSQNDRINVYPFGLGGSTRTEKICLAADGSSIWGSSDEVEEIRIVDAADWISENSIAHIGLVKINIEGGEYELLDRLLESGLVERIDNLQIQFHNIARNSRSEMARIQQQLQRTHAPTYQYDFVWENWARK